MLHKQKSRKVEVFTNVQNAERNLIYERYECSCYINHVGPFNIMNVINVDKYLATQMNDYDAKQAGFAEPRLSLTIGRVEVGLRLG